MLSDIANDLVRESFEPREDLPRIGQVWIYKGRPWWPTKPRRVKITGGSYWGSPCWNGVPSISNAWMFQEILADGTLAEQVEGDYDNNREWFYPEKGF